VKQMDITGPVQLLNLAYHRPHAAWWFLTHDPRVLWGILRGRVIFSFGASGGCGFSFRDRDYLGMRIAERLAKCDQRA